MGRSDVSPRRISPRWLPIISVSLFVIYLLIEGVRCVGPEGGDLRAGLDPGGVKCFAMVLIFAAIPTMLLMRGLAKRAPTRLGLTGSLAGLAGVGAGWIAIALHCPVDNPVHILLWHLALPIVYGFGLGILILSRLLRW